MPHHPHPGPPHPPAHEWIISVHDDHLARANYASHLRALGEALASDGAIEIGGTSVDVPQEVTFDLRYERTPHHTLALVVRDEWTADSPGGTSLDTAHGLVIRVPNRGDTR